MMASGKRPAVVIDLVSGDEEGAGSGGQNRRARRAGAPLPQSTVIDLCGVRSASGAPSSQTQWARPGAPFTCPICFCETQPADGATLRTCGHPLCVECLTQYVRGKVTAGDVLPDQLVCPYTEPSRCAVALAPTEVKRCLESQEDVARYEHLTLLRVAETEADMGACPTPGCAYLFVWEEDNRKLECPLCRKSYCLVCRVTPWHAGRRCEEIAAEGGDSTAADLCFERFAKGENLRQCPGCKSWVQRRGGCDAMHCRCNCVFCYTCGGTLKRTAKKVGAKECTCGVQTHSLLQQHEAAGTNHNLQLPGRHAVGDSDDDDDSAADDEDWSDQSGEW